VHVVSLAVEFDQFDIKLSANGARGVLAEG